MTLKSLGGTYRDLGNAKEAKKLLEGALAITEQAYGKSHPKISRILSRLSDAHRDLGNTKESKEFHEKALAIKSVMPI